MACKEDEALTSVYVSGKVQGGLRHEGISGGGSF